MPSGTVAYYPFNGNANDESGNGHDGTVSGAKLTTDRNGVANKAYDFDGKSVITVKDAPGLQASEFTISAWVKVDKSWSYNSHYIVAKESGLHTGISLAIDQNSSVYGQGNFAARFTVGGGGTIVNNLFEVLTPAQLTAGWLHLVGVFDGANATLYIDGVEAESKSIAGTFKPSTSPMLIGSTNHRGDQKFVGKIDDVMFFDQALSEAQVKAL